MVEKPGGAARLARIVAERMTALPAGALERSRDGKLSNLLDALEYFVPHVLHQEHPEWQWESLDGFLIGRAKKSTKGSVSLMGLAILISDQAVTPFHVDLHPAPDGSLERAEVRLGERAGGAMGISGPPYTSSVVPGLLHNFMQRVSTVDWVFRATYIGGSLNRPG